MAYNRKNKFGLRDGKIVMVVMMSEPFSFPYGVRVSDGRLHVTRKRLTRYRTIRTSLLSPLES